MELELGNLENLQVDRVREALQEILSEEPGSLPDGFCTCQLCLVDVVAVALNALPPRYVADKYYKFPESPEGEDRALEIAQRAVRMAIRRVGRRPHHDR